MRITIGTQKVREQNVVFNKETYPYWVCVFQDGKKVRFKCELDDPTTVELERAFYIRNDETRYFRGRGPF